jgi:hypothetical protein
MRGRGCGGFCGGREKCGDSSPMAQNDSFKMKGHKNEYGDSGCARMTTVKRMTIRKEEIRKED